MYYAQFQKLNNRKWNADKGKLVTVTPYLEDVLGSDGVFILNGRHSIDRMIGQCHTRIQKLLVTVNAFQICRGDRFTESKVIYQSPTREDRRW